MTRVDVTGTFEIMKGLPGADPGYMFEYAMGDRTWGKCARP